ncbi:uncharacterized protein LOC109523597 [Hippocampus comes]|uniref:uncharacterized protein LOC109523597 n=1 Tax=Hippocampus comes TaxID=109280 RepID=UPI00094E0635|nr:PREDICTED: uncharacterized protein LOC109523597 [Hippocampus comes]
MAVGGQQKSFNLYCIIPLWPIETRGGWGLAPVGVELIMKGQLSGSNGLPHQHHILSVGPHGKDLQAVMTGQQKLVSLWLLLLLVVALCPGAQYTYSKRGGGTHKSGKSNKVPASKGHGLPKPGLKWAGAAAAGMLGGTGTGYGLGFLGRPKYGSRGHAGQKTESSGRHDSHGQTFRNQSRWRAFLKAAAPAHLSNSLLLLGHALTFLTGLCMGAL